MNVVKYVPTFCTVFHSNVFIQHAAVQALQKAIAAAEEAKLQKEQSVIREQQASKDVRRLTDKLTGLQADIREHYTKEIVEYVFLLL